MLKVLQEFPVLRQTEVFLFFFSDAFQTKSFIKTAGGRGVSLPKLTANGDLPTSRGEASFMNKMFNRGGSLLVNMRPQINGSVVAENQNKLKFN